MKKPCELYIEIVLHLLRTAKKGKSVTIHRRTLQILTTETSNTKNGFNFLNAAYQLRSSSRLERHNVISVRYITETISPLDPKI